MAMMKSIGRTLAHVDVAANTSVRIHEDFFNSHRISQHLSDQAVPATCKNLVSGYPTYQELARHRYGQLPCRPTLPGSRWACSGCKFVVPRAGGAYDARDKGPNRKFRINLNAGLYSTTF